MTNATVRPPTTDEQIAEFKGVSTQDGVVSGVQESRPLGGSVNNEEGNTEDNQAAGDEGQQANQQGQRAAPKAKSAQDRIDQAVKRQREAERRADMAEGRYQALESRFSQLEARLSGGGQPQNLTNGGQQNNATDPKAPDPAKYQYGELDSRYVADLARYEAGKVIEGERQAQQQASRAAQAAQERQMVTDFGAKGAEKYADFVETVLESGRRDEWPLTETVGKLAFDSEHGHDILYALATDHAEATRVAKMTPQRQAAWFGQQEAKWSAASPAANRGQDQQRQQAQPNGQAQTVRTTQAPPPPSVRLRGAGNVNPVSSDTTDFAAFEALAMGGGATNRH